MPVGGQGECERRIEVFVKIQKNNVFFFFFFCFFLGGGGRVRGVGVGGVRVDVNEELNFSWMGVEVGGRG